MRATYSFQPLLVKPTQPGAPLGQGTHRLESVRRLGASPSPRVVETQVDEGTSHGGLRPVLPGDPQALLVVLHGRIEVLQLPMDPAEMAGEQRQPETVTIAPGHLDPLPERGERLGHAAQLRP